MRRARLAVLVVLAAVGLAACGGDDEASTSSLPPTEPPVTRPGPASTSSTTSTAPARSGPSDLRDGLLPPEAFGDGLSLDPRIGTGAFETELCEDVTVEQTWDDQASQALSAADGTVVKQAVLRAPDDATATDLFAAIAADLDRCLPGESVALDAVLADDGGTADEAVLSDRSGPSGTDDVGLVRVGPLVSIVTVTGPDGTAGLDPTVLATAADALAV